MTTSDITNENEWQQVAQQVTTNGNKWQWVAMSESK